MNDQIPTSDTHSAVPTSAPTAMDAKRKKRQWILWGSIAGACIVALAAAASVLASEAAEQARQEQVAAELEEFRANQFKEGAESCVENMNTVEIMDNGDAIQFYRVAVLGGASGGELFCFLDHLGAPTSLETKIGQTRALDGTRTVEWDEFEATWTYHPDSGLNFLVERTGEPVMPNE